MLALIAANFPFAYFCLTLNLHIFLIPLLNIPPPPYKKKTPKIVLEHLYKLCKRIPLNISHDRLLLLWLTAIIQSSLQVFSIFAHVSAYSLNFHYPIEKNKKKKRRKKSTNYRFHNIKVPRVTFKTLFLPRNPNLVLVRSTFSWLQIWRAKEGLRLQNLFFLISFFCHTIKNKLL